MKKIIRLGFIFILFSLLFLIFPNPKNNVYGLNKNMDDMNKKNIIILKNKTKNNTINSDENTDIFMNLIENKIIDPVTNKVFNGPINFFKKKYQQENQKIKKKELKIKLKKQREEILKKRKKYIIIDKYIYNKPIYNGFAKSRCTWFVASKTFPFKENSKTIQKKLWNGNANQWLNNAKNKGYKVNDYPKKESIIVFGGNRYSHMGHVGLVKSVNWDNMTIVIEDMRISSKLYEVTVRRILLDDNSIKGYIHINL